MTKKEQILQKLVGVLNKAAPDSEMYLYGSQARGDAQKLSDWDLLILLNIQRLSFDFETKLMDDFYDVELETGEIISPLIYVKKDWNENYSISPFFKIVMKEGIRIK
jgi:predicted nucleotidyltransferase